MSAPPSTNAWSRCRFASCSILPVRMACDLACPFCFSRSSISALAGDRVDWPRIDLEPYFRFARTRGATRLVITGGGEPLLAPEAVLDLVTRGRTFFDEVTCFTNGSRLTPALSEQLAEAGLSYLCWSRHAIEDDAARALMGAGAPALRDFFAAARGLRVRATCVLTRGQVDDPASVDRYIDRLVPFGVREFTFKHTYAPYETSLFRGTRQDLWTREHGIRADPFQDRGEVLFALPWGPEVRRLGDLQVCYYFEPTPAWEKEHQLCRSTNLLSDGKVYASLEDEQSLLFQLER